MCARHRWPHSTPSPCTPSHARILSPSLSFCSKTRGLGAGRKLRTHRRAQLWADKDYKKSHLGSEYKKPVRKWCGESRARRWRLFFSQQCGGTARMGCGLV